MASSMIHIAVANELNKKLKRNKAKLFIGTIAPDISKLVGDNKIKSHFLVDDTSIPNLDLFLNKYKQNLDDDFVLGYYIHLFTDYLWFKYFIDEVVNKDMITKLDGTVVKCNGDMMSLYIYNDYTNMNIKLLDYYNMDLKIFYNDIPSIDNIIEEIPMDKLHLIINKTGEVISKSKEHKDLIFNIDNIQQFVQMASNLIKSELEKLNIS